jgi:excisionase family DNA binding protein
MEYAETYAKLLTVEEVAAMLKMSRQALYEAVRKGLVPAVRIGRRIRFDLDALETWLECGGSPWSNRRRHAASTIF